MPKVKIRAYDNRSLISLYTIPIDVSRPSPSPSPYNFPSVEKWRRTLCSPFSKCWWARPSLIQNLKRSSRAGSCKRTQTWISSETTCRLSHAEGLAENGYSGWVLSVGDSRLSWHFALGAVSLAHGPLTGIWLTLISIAGIKTKMSARRSLRWMHPCSLLWHIRQQIQDDC